MANQIRIFHIHISKMTSKSQYEKIWTRLRSGVTQPLGALRQSATFGPPLLHFGDLPPPSFRSVYHFGSQKIFRDIPQFFLNTKKIFRKHIKIFRIYDIFPLN
jgi:hypothetical protein